MTATKHGEAQSLVTELKMQPTKNDLITGWESVMDTLGDATFHEKHKKIDLARVTRK